VDAVTAVSEGGGMVTRKEVLTKVTRGELERAVADGSLLRVGWGRYALPTDAVAKKAAHEVHGVAILTSAAAHWGWRRKWDPRKPQVAVRRGRRVRAELHDRYDVRWRNVAAADVVDGWVTGRVRTVIDCAVLLPFDQALAIADSALRSGTVTRDQLEGRLDGLAAQLRPRVRRVIEAADARAANPFESVLRAIALEVAGLEAEPQVRIDDAEGFVGRVDLADRRLRIVIEGESFEFHGEREMLDRDCQRYSRLTADGWLVLRFSWTQVMTKPDLVRRVLERTVRTWHARRPCQCQLAS
jgi:very-short-patch-repair endonuclease